MNHTVIAKHFKVHLLKYKPFHSVSRVGVTYVRERNTRDIETQNTIFSKLLDKTILNHMVYHCSKRWGNLNLIQIALHPACTSGSRNHSSVAVVVVFVCGFWLLFVYFFFFKNIFFSRQWNCKATLWKKWGRWVNGALKGQ